MTIYFYGNSVLHACAYNAVQYFQIIIRPDSLALILRLLDVTIEKLQYSKLFLIRTLKRSDTWASFIESSAKRRQLF